MAREILVIAGTAIDAVCIVLLGICLVKKIKNKKN